MSSSPLHFIIRPRGQRDGYSLAGDTLPYVMWYSEMHHAADYAQSRAGTHRALIEIYDASGDLIQAIQHGTDDGASVLGRI